MVNSTPGHGGQQPSSRSLKMMSELLGAVIAISSQPEIQDIAREACNQMLSLLGVDSCAISLWNKEEDTVVLLTESRREPETSQDEWYKPYPLDDFPATRHVLENGQAAQVRIDDPEACEAEKELLVKFESKAMLMLPLVTEGQVIGLAELFDFSTPRIFSNEEIALVYLLLNQVGILIERAQLMHGTERRADDLEKLRKANLNLVAIDQLDAMYQVILENVIYLFPNTAGTFVYQCIDGILVYESSLLPDGSHPGIWADIHNNGMVVSVANSGNSMVIEDMSKHPLFKDFPERTPSTIIGIPIKTGGKVYAVLIVRFPKVRPVAESTIRILHLFGDQAAVTIERIINMQEVKQRVFELESLRQTSLALTSSLNVDEVLQSILKSVLYLSKDAMDAHLFLYEDGKLSFGAALWSDEKYKGIVLQPRKNGLTMTVAKKGTIIAIPDMRKHPSFTGVESEDPDVWKGSIVGLPIKLGDDVIGVMTVAYRTPRQFTSDNLRVLGLLANQASLAISNARLHQSISRQARTDALTGLANRRAFNQFLEEEINRAGRYNRSFSIVMMDLDGFKQVNDTYGHLQGDMVLKSVATSLVHSVRGSDFLARWGGDEFILLLPETELESAQITARKISQIVSDKTFSSFGLDLPPLVLRLTMGVVNYPHHGKTARELIQNADALLYEGKRIKETRNIK